MHQHRLRKSLYTDYSECGICGSLFRRDHPDPVIYGSDYWDGVNRSTLEDQVYNITEFKNEAGETKAEAVLKHCRSGAMALEIGCGPGALLPLLGQMHWSVTGIEYDATYSDRIRAIAGDMPTLIFGPFPEVTNTIAEGRFDCIVALDLLEHMRDGQAFIAEIHRLLSRRGRMILMLPAIYEDGHWDPRFLHPEHVAIYSQAFLREWLGETFKTVQFDRWVTGHEVIVADKA